MKYFTRSVATLCILLLFTATGYAQRCNVGPTTIFGQNGSVPSNPDTRDGTPYPVVSVSDSENNADGTNKIGFDYLKIGKKSSDNWDEDVTWKEGEIPNDKDFRAKFKKKNDAWPSDRICVQLYFSNNKYFSLSDDEKIGHKECDTFDTGDDKESVYIEDVDLPVHRMYPGRNYYVFAHAVDEDGNLLDVSSRTTEEEYVKIDVIHRKFDTEVTAVSVPSSVGGGDTFSLNVTVKNHLDSTQENVELDLWFLGNTQRVNLGTMTAGQTRAKSFTLTAPAEEGTFGLVALSDPRALIHETNRENNRKAVTVTVTQPEPPPPSPGFDVAIGYLSIDPVDWSRDTVQARATIWNGNRDISSLWLDCNLGEAKGITQVTNLLAWEERNNIPCFIPLSDLSQTGEVPFSMVADPNNLLEDNDTTNNTAGWNEWVPNKPQPYDLSVGHGALEEATAGRHLPASMTIFNGSVAQSNLSVTCSLGDAQGQLTVANLESWEERRVTCTIDATNLEGNQVHNFSICAHPNDSNPANDCQAWQEWVEPNLVATYDLSTGYGELEDKTVGGLMRASVTLYNGALPQSSLPVSCSLGSANGQLTVSNLEAWEERRVTCLIDATTLSGNQVYNFEICANPNDTNSGNDCQGWQEWVTAP